MQRIVKFIFLTWIFFYVGLSYANTFNFKPVGSLPTSVHAGQTVTATYKVTSAGTFPPGKYHLIFSLLSNRSNVTQDLTVANACQVNPISPSGCNLKLNIVGPVSGPIKICDDFNGSPGLNCNIPSSPDDFLNVKANQAPLLTVSPTITILGPNVAQIFTVINTSKKKAAANVTMTIPADIQSQLAGPAVYNGCTSIAPLGTCTITITASATPDAVSGFATIQGTNTQAPAPTVAITTGAAPALTVSPPTTRLGPNGVQQFIVVNTSTTTPATDVTMTIPDNVQAQLTSPPVYSGCAPIAPLGTCTITITAIATPNAQSGIATVQGTNTALLAPTVAITTDSAPILTVSPTTTVLGSNGSQQFVVTNTSATIAAQNITITIPPNVMEQMLGAPVYNGCTTIAPLGNCTITITAVSSPTAQSGIASVQGTNTAAPAPTVAITTDSAPTLTVSPSSANITFNGTQVFTVTNTGTIPAQNISMTISGNVQGQLVGLPIYSSDCASLLPGSSACTITIQAVTTPSGQSGIGTVQGSNTAAPSPAVSIFILPICTVLGNTAVANSGNSIITGSVCVAPGTSITGFPPGQTIPAGQFHSNDSIAVADHNDAATLYNIIAGLSCDTNLSGQNLGSVTPAPGVYCFNSSAALNGTLILNGSATDKWYFQIGTTLTTAVAANVILTGGAVPGNVYWQIGTSGIFGANTTFKGQVVALTDLTLGANVNHLGRLWVQNAAVTLDTDSISP